MNDDDGDDVIVMFSHIVSVNFTYIIYEQPGVAWANDAWWGRTCICHCVRWLQKSPKTIFIFSTIVFLLFIAINWIYLLFRRSWCLPKPIWAAARPMDGMSQFVWWSSSYNHCVCMMIIIYDDDGQVSVKIDNGDLISQPVLVDYFTLLPTSYVKPSVLRQEVSLSLFSFLLSPSLYSIVHKGSCLFKVHDPFF